jgi:hypothetical protein
MTTSGGTATVLITGPTSRLGRALALMVGRPETDRPDLLLVGRPGQRLTEVVDLVRAAGCDCGSDPLRPLTPGRKASLTPRWVRFARRRFP